MPCPAPWVLKVWDLGFTQLFEQTRSPAASLGLMGRTSVAIAAGSPGLELHGAGLAGRFLT